MVESFTGRDAGGTIATSFSRPGPLCFFTFKQLGSSPQRDAVHRNVIAEVGYAVYAMGFTV